MQWQPEFAVSVIEASLWGNTVADAATAFIQHAAADEGTDLPALTGLVEPALLADLPDAVDSLDDRAWMPKPPLASDVGQLMDALPPLANVLRYGNVRQTDAAHDRPGGRRAGGAHLHRPAGACSCLNDEAAAAMFARLNRVHGALALLQNEEHRQSLAGACWSRWPTRPGCTACSPGGPAPLLLDQGTVRCRRNLAPAGAGAFDGQRRRLRPPPGWKGFCKDSGVLLLHDDALWKVLDDWVAALPARCLYPAPAAAAPHLRTLSAPERRQIGERAKQGAVPGCATTASPADFDVAAGRSRAAAAGADTGRCSSMQGTRHDRHDIDRPDDERLRRWRLILGGDSADGTGFGSARQLTWASTAP